METLLIGGPPYCDYLISNGDINMSASRTNYIPALRYEGLTGLYDTVMDKLAQGELHVADWGRAGNAFIRLAFFLVQLLDGFRTTTDNVHGRLPVLFRQSDLQAIQETARSATIFGTVSLYKASKPVG